MTATAVEVWQMWISKTGHPLLKECFNSMENTFSKSNEKYCLELYTGLNYKEWEEWYILC